MSTSVARSKNTAVGKRIDKIKTLSGIKSRDIAQLLDTTPQTVSRWQTGASSPHRGKLDRLLILEWLLDQLSQFYDPEEARLWLFSPHSRLKGTRPADLIAAGRVDEVLDLVDQLQSAAYI